ncbi:MAG: ATP-binding protein [Actinobacteria bacterium]|nr:ATP-binding protein [Actinomycetota bacterium]
MIQTVVSPLLVGRAEQLDHLEDGLLAANRGESRFVVLAGEAGIGKTRLAGVLLWNQISGRKPMTPLKTPGNCSARPNDSPSHSFWLSAPGSSNVDPCLSCAVRN